MTEKIKKRNVNKVFDSANGLAQLFILVGKSGRGKSHLMRYLLTDKWCSGHYKFGLVMTKSLYDNEYDYIAKKAVLEYHPEKLEKYIENLKKIKAQNKNLPNSFLVLDDVQGVLDDSSSFFSNFIAQHRHLNVDVYIAVQYVSGRKGISPLCKEQTSHAILFQSRTKRTLENLFLAFGGLFASFNEFKDYFLNATKEKYSAMVYSEHIDELDDNYITIQAPKEFPKCDFKF